MSEAFSARVRLHSKGEREMLHSLLEKKTHESPSQSQKVEKTPTYVCNSRTLRSFIV